MTEEKEEKEEKEKKNCHMLITSPLNEGGRDKKRPMCDYPVKTPKLQIQGERGPRHYNKQTPKEQFAASVNLTVKSML